MPISRDAIEQLTAALRGLLNVKGRDGRGLLRELSEGYGSEGAYTFCNVCEDADGHKEWCAVGVAERVLRLIQIERASDQISVADDVPEARDAILQMAEQGHAEAQFTLGDMYYTGLIGDVAKEQRGDEGHDGRQDLAQAAAWYRKAAAQGYAPAQSALANMFYAGKGGPQDSAQAVRWFRQLADQGDVDAQFILGGMYEAGNGVPQDRVEAHMWYSLAAARASWEDIRGFEEPRDVLARTMTPEQLVEAQQRASEWLGDFERRGR